MGVTAADDDVLSEQSLRWGTPPVPHSSATVGAWAESPSAGVLGSGSRLRCHERAQGRVASGEVGAATVERHRADAHRRSSSSGRREERIQVRVAVRAVHELDVGGRDVVLGGQFPGAVEDAAAAELGGEGVELEALQLSPSVVRMPRAASAGLAMPLPTPPASTVRRWGWNQAGAVQTGQPRSEERVGRPLDGAQLAGLVPRARVARAGERPNVRLRGGEVGRGRSPGRWRSRSPPRWSRARGP